MRRAGRGKPSRPRRRWRRPSLPHVPAPALAAQRPPQWRVARRMVHSSHRDFMTARIASVVLGLALLWAAGSASAAENWSQWRGANRDGVALEVAPRKEWPQELQLKWQIEVGLGHSSPVVAGERVYVFTRQDDKETVRAISQADGKDIWRKSYPAPYEVSPPAAGHGKGPKSTPVVADGRLFTLGISGILSCWDAESGELKWRKEFSKQFKHTSPLYGTAMSPLIDHGRLIVHVGGHDSGRWSRSTWPTAKWPGPGTATDRPIRRRSWPSFPARADHRANAECLRRRRRRQGRAALENPLQNRVRSELRHAGRLRTVDHLLRIQPRHRPLPYRKTG